MDWMLDAGCWMLAHGWLVIGGVMLLGVTRVMVRRRRARKPMMCLDLTGRHWSAMAMMYDQRQVDEIANMSFATGLVIGAMTVIALGFVLLVLCLRGSGNRSRNGRGVS